MKQFNRRYALALLSALLRVSHAFIVNRPLVAKNKRSTAIIPAATSDDELAELDKARAEFEALLFQEHQLGTNANDDILTSAGRHRRKLEIGLLESLYESDEAVDEMMHLWMYEHTVAAAQELERMEEICSQGLVEEEKGLRRMVHEYPQWAEPRVRLATLLFFKGKSEEAYATALQAREIKPWHFEVYPLLVMLSLREQDFGQALRWARLGLPDMRPHGSNKRRSAWITSAIEAAREQWEEAERVTACARSGRSQEEELWSSGEVFQ